MALPAPRFVLAHGVLQSSSLFPADPSRDERFIAAVKGEFPNLLSRQVLPPEAPPTTPHLSFSSTSSQLVVSRAQTDFEVRFYGDYVKDIDRSLDYVERKMRAILMAFEAIEVSAAMMGVIATLHFSFDGADAEDGPAEHILRTHFREEFEANAVQDAVARVALKVEDKYFVTLTVSNYEQRTLQHPMMPGVQQITMRPWDGEVTDRGIELAVDINNNLEGRLAASAPVVTETTIHAVTGLLRRVVTSAGRTYAETGRVTVADLAGERA